MENKVIILVSSLGGPPLVNDILSSLDANSNIPIIVLQQMESDFSEPLTSAWNKTSSIPLIRLTDEKVMRGNCAYVIPYSAYPVFQSNEDEVTIKSEYISNYDSVTKQWCQVIENCKDQFDDNILLIFLANTYKIDQRLQKILQTVESSDATLVYCSDAHCNYDEQGGDAQAGSHLEMSVDQIVELISRYAKAGYHKSEYVTST